MINIFQNKNTVLPLASIILVCIIAAGLHLTDNVLGAANNNTTPYIVHVEGEPER